MCLILRGTDTIGFGNSEAVQLHTHLRWSICLWKGEKIENVESDLTTQKG
jgi:hypothetical protein